MAPPDRESVEEITELVDHVTATLGHRALSEHKRMELDRSGPPGPRSGGAGGDGRAWWRGPPTEASLLGYAHLTGDRAAAPVRRRTGGRSRVGLTGGEVDLGDDPVADALLDAVVEFVARKGGGSLRLWVAKAGASDDARAGSHGFVTERDAHPDALSAAAPRPRRSTGPSPTIETRAFRPGRRRGTPGWPPTTGPSPPIPSRATGIWPPCWSGSRSRGSTRRGCCVLESEGRLAGSCWTKIHARHRSPDGRDLRDRRRPRLPRPGLGSRPSPVAGLDWLAGAGPHRRACSTSTPTTRRRCRCTGRWASPRTTSTAPTWDRRPGLTNPEPVAVGRHRPGTRRSAANPTRCPIE